jgi:hypothetical protein
MPRTLASLSIVLLLAAAAARAAEPPPPAVTVVGSGEVRAAPDSARITAGVVTESSSAAEAVRANSTAMQRVLAVLETQGIPEKSVQTQGFSVGPVYDEATVGRRAPRVVGYRVSNQVAVQVEGVDKVGAVLDAVVTAGANELGGVEFSLAEPTPLLDEARRRAVADARRRAELYASAAGVRLGAVLRIDEAGGGPQPVAFARGMMAEMAAAPPVAPGELVLSAAVTISFAIAP